MFLSKLLNIIISMVRVYYTIDLDSLSRYEVTQHTIPD